MVMEQTLQESADAGIAQPNRRKFGSFFLKPEYNLKFGYRIISAGFVFFGATAWLVWQKLGQYDVMLNLGFDGHVSPLAAAGVLGEIAQITLGGFLGFVLYASMYALLTCHRVGGPTVAILDTIQRMKYGEYQLDRKLRKADELQPVQEELIKLAETLQEKKHD